MNQRQLRYFLVTARCEHMGRAAAELRISESTLSRSIAQLERDHGVAFFDRVGRGVRLNPYGRLFTASVEQAFAVLESGRHELQALARFGTASVALGFIASLGPRLVPDLLRRVRSSVTPLEVRLTQASAQALRSRLLDGDLDLTLATQRFDDAAVDWRPLWEEGFVALVGPSHALARRVEVEFADIAREQILSFGSSETARDAFARLARTTGIAPNVVFASDDISTLSALAATGFGIAVVPDSLAVPYDGLTPVRLRSAPTRTVGIATARSRPLSEAAARFHASVLEMAAANRAGRPGRGARSRGTALGWNYSAPARA